MELACQAYETPETSRLKLGGSEDGGVGGRRVIPFLHTKERIWLI